MPRGVRSKCTRACPVGAIRSIVHGINKPPKALLQALRLSFHFGLRISRPRPGNVTAAIALVRRDWGRTKENSSNGRRVDLRRPSAVVGPKRQERHQLLTYDRDVRKQCCRLALVIAGRRRKKLQKHLRSFDSWPNRRFQFLETPASYSSSSRDLRSKKRRKCSIRDCTYDGIVRTPIKGPRQSAGERKQVTSPLLEGIVVFVRRDCVGKRLMSQQDSGWRGAAS